MQDLTPEGRRAVDDLAQRYGVSSDAVSTLLRALVAGNGTMAQFSHPELGGMGQWSQGGMTMVGDMFNQGLKARVDGLCSELATLLRGQQLTFAGSFQSQSQGGSGGQGNASLFVQSSGGMYSNWWPSELGTPAATGAQNNVRYAWFPGTRRLAIDLGGNLSVYDTLDHQIGGFSQQQGSGGSLTFTSQRGLVRVLDLPIISGADALPQPAPEPVAVAPIASYVPEPVAPPPPVMEPMSPPPPPPVMEQVPQQAPSAPQPAAQPSGSMDDILSKIERLADLRQKGILTDEEFSAKKGELLARL
ncbi:MAG: SHOCT domain-containing protein [Geminicoccaceae bacterium]